MKKEYESPLMEIEWFESVEMIAGYSHGTDFIPDTGWEDDFGDL